MTQDDDKAESRPTPLPIAFAERTDVGRAREDNQDAMGHATAESERLWVVCDGMGGHAGGSTASRMAVETILEVFGGADRELSAAKRLERAIRAANKRVFDAAKADRSLKGMGTTVVALLIDTEVQVAHVAHVGDSRVYLARGGVFRRLTRDHTMVQQMVDDGILTDEQAAEHPHGNVISRSLGSGKNVEVEHTEAPIELEDGDLFLLCSDGLTGFVAEDDIAEILWGNKPKPAAAALVAQANAGGGEDNITVQVVRVGGAPDAPVQIEIVHPEVRPSGLLDELRERAEALGGRRLRKKRDTAATAPSDAGDRAKDDAQKTSDDGDLESPVLPPTDDIRSDLESPLLPAVVIGLLIGIIAFLAVYLTVNQVVPPPEPEPAAVESQAGEAEEGAEL